MNTREYADKYIILITDEGCKNGAYVSPGQYDETYTVDKEIDALKQEGYCVSVAANTFYYSQFSSLVKGGSKPGVLTNIYSSFNTAFSGLVELMASSTANGMWIRLADCRVIRISENGDYDNDGILDSAELGDIKERTENGHTYEYYTFRSDPTKADTDGDGLKDIVDSNPLRYDLILDVEKEPRIINNKILFGAYVLKFNNGKTFNVIFNDSFSLETYLNTIHKSHNFLTLLDAYFDSIDIEKITGKKLDFITNEIKSNIQNDYSVEEATLLAPFDMEGIRYITSTSKDDIYQLNLYNNLFGDLNIDDMNRFFYKSWDYRLETQWDFNRRFEREFAAQVLLGKWSDNEDHYILSDFVEMTIGILPPVGVAQAIRDTSYDLNVWDSDNATLKDFFVVGVDALGALDLIKGGKNVLKFVKKSDNIIQISKVADVGTEEMLKISDNIVGSANIGTNLYDKEGLANILTAADNLTIEERKLLANAKGLVQYDNVLVRQLAQKKAKIQALNQLDGSQLEEAERQFLNIVDKRLKDGYNPEFYT